MTSLQLNSHSPKQTQRLGAHLGSLAQAGDIFLLSGSLGAGKTCLTQGIAIGLGIGGYAPSPSFIIVREHYGRLPLYHIDFYRLEHIEEIVDLGIDEYLYGNGVCVIEWAERAIKIMPGENLLITLGYVSDMERSLTLEAGGDHYSKLLEALDRNLKKNKKEKWS